MMTVRGERESPWNGCCCHGEEVRTPLLHEPLALHHPEPMLLIHYHQLQILKLHCFLYQRMCSYHKINCAGSQAHADILRLPLWNRTCEQCDGGVMHLSTALLPLQIGIEMYECFSDALHVLLRKDFRGNHESALAAVSYDIRHHSRCDESLPGAHIPLEEPRHGFALLHVFENLVNGNLLAVRRREAQRCEECPDEFYIHRNLQPLLRSPLPFSLPFQSFLLHPVHLLKLHPLQRSLDLGGIVWKMKRIDGITAGEEMLLFQHGFRKSFRNLGYRPLDQCHFFPQPLARNNLMLGIYRNQPPCMYKVLPTHFCRFELRALKLHLLPVQNQLAREHHFLPIREHTGDVRLIEPDNLGFRTFCIREYSFHQHFMASRTDESERMYSSANTHFLIETGTLYRRHLREIFMRPRQVEQQILHRMQGHSSQSFYVVSLRLQNLCEGCAEFHRSSIPHHSSCAARSSNSVISAFEPT